MARHIRRAGIVSRLKALVSVIEDFVRADNASSLGKTSTGANWDTIRGSWGINTNKARSTTAESSYPLSTLTFTKEDVTMSVSGVGPGVGTAFWVTDSNNWWGTYIDAVQTCQTCSNAQNPATWTYVVAQNSTCSTYSTVIGNCTTYSTVPGNCSTYSTVTNCTTYSTVPGNCSTYSTVTNYPCNANAAANTPCNSSSCTTYNAYVTSNCASWNTPVVYNGWLGYAITYVWNYCCQAGGCGGTYLNGNTIAASCGGCTPCSYGVNSTYYPRWYYGYNYNCATFNASVPAACTAWTCNAYSTNYTCTTYSTVRNYPCNAYNATNYPCNAVSTSYPCNATNPTAYPCNVRNPSNYPCNAWNATNYTSQASTYNATTYYQCNCTTDYKINLIKMVSGTVSNVATFAFNAAINSFKTILSGSTVTVRAYSSTGYTSQIGTDQSTTVSGYTKTKKHGILKGVVTYSPASTTDIDEFRVE